MNRKTAQPAAPTVSPVVAGVCIAVVVALALFLGIRALRPPAAAEPSAQVTKPDTVSQINGQSVPKNVPSYYWKEHQAGGQPAPAGGSQ